jgi:antitoxin YefM
MPTETTYSHARAHFASLCEEAISTREPIIIHRRGAEDVALIAAAELRGLLETAHLLRSPKNARRLLTALARARSEDLSPATVGDLRQELDLGETR